MSFTELYEKIEKGDYEDFLEKIQSDSSLSSLESDYLRISYDIKKNDRESAQNLVLQAKESAIGEIHQVAMQVKFLSFIIFEGDEDGFKEELSTIEKYFDISNHYEEMVLKLIQADYHHYHAIFHLMRAEFDQSEIWFKKAIELEEIIDIDLRRGKVKNNYSLLQADKGEIVKAQSINFEVKKIWERIGSLHNLGQLFGNISELYEIRGVYESALYFAREAKKILEDIGNNYEKMMIKGVIFRILRKSEKGSNEEIEESFDFLIDQLNKDESLLNNQLTARILVEMTTFATFSKRERIEEVFNLFEQLSKSTHEGNYVTYHFELAKGVYNSKSGRFRDKIGSNDTFKKLLKSQEIDFFVQHKAGEYLLDNLLFEYQSTRDQQVLDEIDYYLDIFNEWVSKRNSLEIEVKFRLFKLQIKLYKTPEITVHNQFLRLLVFTIENGMHRYQKYISSKYKRYKELLSNKSETFDLLSEISRIEAIDKQEDDVVYSDIVLYDRFNQLHSLSGKEIPEYHDLEISSMSELVGNYYITTNYPDNLLISKFTTFPWIGIVFRGDVEKAIMRLDLAVNAISSTLAFNDLRKTVPNILHTDQVRDLVSDILEFKEMIDYNITPSEFSKLKDYKLLLHPMRLAIMDILKRVFSIPRKDLEKTIQGNRGTFASHLTKLIDNELLQAETQFFNDEPRMVINITNPGISYYNEFKSIIQKI